MNDHTLITDKQEVLEKKGAGLLAAMIRTSLSETNRAIVGVPGGRSVGGVLRRLEQERLDWSRVQFFMVDERLVPISHPESNFGLVASALEPFVARHNLHPYRHNPGDQMAPLTAYGRQLHGFGGRFDAVLLSGGEDGHIASLFPEHATIYSDEALFLLTDSAPKPPPGRMSASKKLIGSSRAGVLLFFGSAKLNALRSFLDETVPLDRCPAKIVNNLPLRYVLTDQPA
jgi:6-phosphogluconolactonase